MNYRRGFQRIYALVFGAWVTTTLLILPPQRLAFWRKWSVFDEFAAHPCATQAEISKNQQDHQPTEERPCSDQEIFNQVEEEARHAEPPKWIYDHITLAVPIESRLQRFMWLLGLLILPPAIGYAAFFYIATWIFRGFKSSTRGLKN
jgi:hypothetical protein